MFNAPETRATHDDERAQASAGVGGRWQVVCIPKVYPAAIGLERQQAIADGLTSQTAAPSLIVWRCEPTLLVTRPETRLPHFDAAVAELQAAGWPVALRKSGGSACPVGSGTLQVSTIEAACPDASMSAKYAVLTNLIRSTLRFFQIDSGVGPIAGAYCPGSHDLAVEGKKVAGMSQHWFRNRNRVRCVVTSASINIEEAPDVLAGVVNQFYSSAGGSLRCKAATLTNMQLYDGAAYLAGGNLVSAVVNFLGSSADMLPGGAQARSSARLAI